MDGLARVAFGRGCRPYIKALLATQTAIGHEVKAKAVAICESFIFQAECVRDAEMPQTAVH